MIIVQESEQGLMVAMGRAEYDAFVRYQRLLEKEGAAQTEAQWKEGFEAALVSLHLDARTFNPLARALFHDCFRDEQGNRMTFDQVAKEAVSVYRHFGPKGHYRCKGLGRVRNFGKVRFTEFVLALMEKGY